MQRVRHTDARYGTSGPLLRMFSVNPRVCVAALSVALVVSACASQIPPSRPGEIAFGIPSAIGTDGIEEFTRQSNLQVIYSADDLRSVHTRTVTGALRPADALARLLRGTGFGYTFLDDDTVLIVRNRSQALR